MLLLLGGAAALDDLGQVLLKFGAIHNALSLHNPCIAWSDPPRSYLRTIRI